MAHQRPRKPAPRSGTPWARIRTRPPSAAGCPCRDGRESAALEVPATLILEDGSRRELRNRLPPTFRRDTTGSKDGAETRERLIVCPPRCYVPEDLWDWGWSVQLPSMRSQASWGIGDLADLRELASWSRDTFRIRRAVSESIARALSGAASGSKPVFSNQPPFPRIRSIYTLRKYPARIAWTFENNRSPAAR